MSGSATRQLTIYQTLLTGAPVTKKDLVERFDVDERSIQRDISNIRNFIAEENLELELEYRRSTKAYQLVGKTQTFGKAHVLALVKILLASRAFNKDETEQLIELLLARLEPGEQRELNWIIKNEQSNYLPLTSATELLKPLWDFSLYIVRSQAVDITYTKQRGEKVTRTIVPKLSSFQIIIFTSFRIILSMIMTYFTALTGSKSGILQTKKSKLSIVIAIKTANYGKRSNI